MNPNHSALHPRPVRLRGGQQFHGQSLGVPDPRPHPVRQRLRQQLAKNVDDDVLCNFEFGGEKVEGGADGAGRLFQRSASAAPVRG